MTLINSRKFKISNHQAKKVKPIMETEFAELGADLLEKLTWGNFGADSATEALNLLTPNST